MISNKHVTLGVIHVVRRRVVKDALLRITFVRYDLLVSAQVVFTDGDPAEKHPSYARSHRVPVRRKVAQCAGVLEREIHDSDSTPHRFE